MGSGQHHVADGRRHHDQGHQPQARARSGAVAGQSPGRRRPQLGRRTCVMSDTANSPWGSWKNMKATV